MDPGEDPKSLHRDLRAASGEEPAAGRHPLSAGAIEEIDGLLGSFRGWLLEAEREAPARGSSESTSNVADIEDIDLHTLISELIALRKEVGLEARAGKAAREELQSARAAFGDGIAAIRASLRDGLNSGFETLERALSRRDSETESRREREVTEARQGELRAIETLLDAREALVRGSNASSGARRRLGWRRALVPTALVDGLAQGYELGLRKIESALAALGVEPIECERRSFDPESMKAVELDRRDESPGRVLEEIRPGYRFNGRVIRYAEVKVVAEKPEKC